MNQTERAALKRRIKAKTNVDKSTGCHIATFSLNRKNGYPRATVNGSSVLIHRLAYQLWVSEIQEHEVIHHTCGNRRCVNPKHLQATGSHQNQAEMRERHAYQRRIAELEAQLRACVCQGTTSTL
jgi:hypothetical protein